MSGLQLIEARIAREREERERSLRDAVRVLAEEASDAAPKLLARGVDAGGLLGELAAIVQGYARGGTYDEMERALIATVPRVAALYRQWEAEREAWAREEAEEAGREAERARLLVARGEIVRSLADKRDEIAAIVTTYAPGDPALRDARKVLTIVEGFTRAALAQVCETEEREERRLARKAERQALWSAALADGATLPERIRAIEECERRDRAMSEQWSEEDRRRRNKSALRRRDLRKLQQRPPRRVARARARRRAGARRLARAPASASDGPPSSADDVAPDSDGGAP